MIHACFVDRGVFGNVDQTGSQVLLHLIALYPLLRSTRMMASDALHLIHREWN